MGKKSARKRGKNGAKCQNLPPEGKRFSKDYQPDNNGRKKKLKNIIKSIPKDAQEKIFDVLFTAISQPSRTEAIRLIKEREDELGEYGFVLQIAITALAGENGMAAVETILDRIFGRPAQRSDVNFSADGEISKIVVEVKDCSKKEAVKSEVSQKEPKSEKVDQEAGVSGA